MSLLRKNLLSWPMLLLLAACGFQPMHGEQSDSAATLLAGFVVEAPNDTLGREFKQNLEDRLNPGGHVPDKALYKLVVELTSGVSGVGVARDGTASRYNIVLNSPYTLTRISDGKVIHRGTVRHLASYNNQTNSYFSTFISERDATRRGLVELSKMYRQRMAVVVTQRQTGSAL